MSLLITKRFGCEIYALPRRIVLIPISIVSLVKTSDLYALMKTPTKMQLPITMQPYVINGHVMSAIVVARSIQARIGGVNSSTP